MFLVGLVLFGLGLLALVRGNPLGVVAVIVAVLIWGGLTVVQPNQVRVLTVLGTYRGILGEPGFHWVHPLASRPIVSLKTRSFNSKTLSVNDAQGNPIEIAGTVVWRVQDPYRALFGVERYPEFVEVQAEAALRALASSYSYDDLNQSQRPLEASSPILQTLQAELQERLHQAGVEVVETRLTRLTYAPEIAPIMLRRQQAQAVIAARKLIVQAAVGMVKEALSLLEHDGGLNLDEEKKVSMAQNLLVTLTSDQAATPVINTGTLYG